MKLFSNFFWTPSHIEKHVERHLRELEDSLSRLNRSPLTLKNYKQDLKFYLTWWYSEQQHHCVHAKPHHISAYLRLLEHGGAIIWVARWWQRILFKFEPQKIFYQLPPHKVASRRRHLSSIKKFYQMMKELNQDQAFKKMKENPVRPLLHAMSLKDRDQMPTQALSQIEFEQVWELPMKVETRLALSLMFYAGLRLQEVVDLKVDELDFNQQTIEFIRKGGRRHRLRPEKAEVIFDYALRHLKIRTKPSLWLFCGQKSDRALSSRALSLRVRKLFDKAQLKKSQSPHGLRKSRATFLYQKTRDLLFVRDYLNHKDAKVTQQYIDTGMIWEVEQSSSLGHNSSSDSESVYDS
jgi:integrase/recombinase XerD